MAAALAVIGLGFIHVITGVTSLYELPFDVVRKDRFGYGETLVNAKRIQALPYAAALRKYPVGVRVLQEAGYLPGGPEFEAHMMAQQREDTRQWLTQFEQATGQTARRWQDQLRGDDQVPSGDPEDARACHQRGVVYARRGEYQSALTEFTRAIRRDPTYAHAYHDRALVHTALGNLGSAASDFGKVVEIRPDFVEGYLQRGCLHAAMNAHDQAIADFTHAIALDSQCAQAYFRRSLAYYANGDYDKAWDDVREIRSLRLPVPAGFLQALRTASEADRGETPSSGSR